MKLIFDSGKIWSSTLLKNKILKKGGKGGADSYIWGAIMILSKNWNMTSKTLIRASYYDIFGRNQCSEPLPPLLHPLFTPPLLPPPFIYIPLEWKIQSFPLFWGQTQYSWAPTGCCPPFLPPLFVFLKSPKRTLQILYLSFFVKMRCFSSTDPCHKNELAILLW